MSQGNQTKLRKQAFKINKSNIYQKQNIQHSKTETCSSYSIYSNNCEDIDQPRLANHKNTLQTTGNQVNEEKNHNQIKMVRNTVIKAKIRKQNYFTLHKPASRQKIQKKVIGNVSNQLQENTQNIYKPTCQDIDTYIRTSDCINIIKKFVNSQNQQEIEQAIQIIKCKVVLKDHISDQYSLQTCIIEQTNNYTERLCYKQKLDCNIRNSANRLQYLLNSRINHLATIIGIQ